MRRLLVLAVASAALLSSCKFDGAYDLPLPGSPVDADHAFEVTAEFSDILNVVPKSPVKVDDVTVGEVTDVAREGWHAKITMRISDDVDLPANAVAEIRQVSLLGEKYVALDDPVDQAPEGRLADGAAIPMASTGRNPEVEEVLGALSALLSGGGVDQLATITRELNQVMSGRTDRLRTLLGTLDDVVGTLDGQRTQIIGALESLNHLTTTLNGERRTITDALDAVGPAIDVLRSQQSQLVQMLTSLDRLGVVGTRVINASKADLISVLRDLEPVVSGLADAGDKLAPGLNLLVSFPFPKEASEIVQGDYANTSIKADISLENLLPKGGLLSLPDLPGLPRLSASVVTRCLVSGRLDGGACGRILGNFNALKDLVSRCDTRRVNLVCRLVAGTSKGRGTSGGLLGGLLGGNSGRGGKGGKGGKSGHGGNSGQGGRGGVLGGLLGSLGLDLPGLSRFTTALSSGERDSAPGDRDLYRGSR